MKTDVLIAGGGLAGLYLAYLLEQAGVDYSVAEARSRLGGRVLSLASPGDDGRADDYDLGPAWFWPGQPRMLRLVDELGLDLFLQYADGNLVFQDQDGTVRRDHQFSTMAGSIRVSGGVGQLIEKLSQRIPADRIRSGEKLTKLSLAGDGIHASIRRHDVETEVRSSEVALALPPRLAAQSIIYQPPLGEDAIDAMRSIPTWMASHAKVIAVYDRPFWREAGLSGDGISHCGPLMEIHDASPATSTRGALFGFVGVSAPMRRSGEFDISRLAVEQLVAMFGPDAAAPLDVLVQDWAREALTAVGDDEDEQRQQHPAYGTPPPLRNLWGGKLQLASTEMAPTFGGFLEGALESAEMVAARIAEEETRRFRPSMP
jgi:monoamine oxidase